MTAIRQLWHVTWTRIRARIDAATRIGGAYGVAHHDLAALRLYSLPRGVRQRSRYCY